MENMAITPNNEVIEEIIKALDKSNNVLITLRQQPTVDEVTAAMAMFDILEKYQKYPTAIFSGDLPPDVEFLGAGDLFQKDTDNLRDFIIYLDKSKADRLRYKVDGDYIKVFITPYRTQITQNDIMFEQGDYNIDTVITIGAVKRDDLDIAISEKIQVLHDATVIAINDGPEKSDFATINWENLDGSGACEIMTKIGAAFANGKDKPYLDEVIATVLLTGLIVRTNQFTNEKVTPNTMALAGQLIQAGANQQLIVAQLQNERARASISAEPVVAETPPAANQFQIPGQG